MNCAGRKRRWKGMASNTYVPGNGPKNARIVIVGEQPGRDEAYRTKACFTGPAGQNLNECLTNARINREEVYLTNFIKDYDSPVENYIYFTTHKRQRVGNLTEKGKEYEEILRDELNMVRPNVVIVCGNIPLWVTTSRAGITN